MSEVQIAILDVALKALSRKMILVVAMLIAAVLFGWAMQAGDLTRLGIAATYAILIFIPILYKGDSHE